MVKSDVRKDYYADLGLQPSAEAEEIKKQFRKLALKFHPDRNPGREVEFIAKFQAIQAANEILSDPSQRLKYDTDRLRAGYGKVYGPPKANTQRKTQNPTRPTPTETYSANKYANVPRNGPSAGAQRYASHARADPQQWKQQDTAQTRADAFRGFNNMRGGQAPGWQDFDPATGRATGGVPGPGAQRHPFGASAQSARPKSAFETRQSANTNTQSSKKKSGFAPGAAGGDEPMARNTSAYSNTSRKERPSSQYFSPATPPTAKKPASPEPVQPQSRHAHTPEFERPSRSYAQTGKGERTFFSSTGLGRSATMRTPSGTYTSAHKGTTSPASGRSGRYRSASPKPRRSTNNYDSTSSSDSEEDIPKPKAVPKSRLGAHQKFADFHQQGTATPGNGKDFKSFPVRQAVHATELSDGSFEFYSIPRDPFPYSHADKVGPKGHTSDSAAFPKSPLRSDPQTNSAGSSSSANTDQAHGAQRPQSAAFGRSSTSDLHKKFSAEDWRAHIDQFDFMGSASPIKEPHSRSPAAQNRGRTANRNGQTSSTGSPLLNPFGTPPLRKSSQRQQEPTPFAQAKFSADSWSERLRNLSWTAPEAEKAKHAANGVPPRSPKKQPRAGVKVRSAPQQASVATEADEAKETLNGEIPATGPAADVEEMDLDEDLPTPPDIPPQVPVGGSGSGSYHNLASQAVPGAPPIKKSKPAGPSEGNVPRTDPRTPLFNLDNLRNTAPFTNATSGGIENLEDFHTTLPFESQAKQPKTTKNDIRPRLLQLPNPPRRPRVPEPILPTPTSKHPVLPRDKWNWYVSAMGAYMHEWNAFNSRMLTHFNARHEANQTGLAPGWISAVGDSTRLKMNGADDDDGIDSKDKTHKDADDLNVDESLVPGKSKGGFSAYLRGIEEDIQVRKHWEVACELHRDCILELGQLREWIRNGGKVV